LLTSGVFNVGNITLTLHLPQLHLYRSEMGNSYIILYSSSISYLLTATCCVCIGNSKSRTYSAAAVAIKAGPVKQIYYTKTKHINIVVPITMPNTERVVMTELSCLFHW